MQIISTHVFDVISALFATERIEKQQNISFSFYLFSHKVQELYRGAADIWVWQYR